MFPEEELTAIEARVLGCLVEKSMTTPDNYPISLNSLRLACNQTTNRDPIVSYDDAVVDTALERLRELQLARRLKNPGERVIKHRQIAAETLGIDAGALAVLCVLLLRGPQTPGELKQRTDRLHAFAALEQLEAQLTALGERGLVARLERQPGQKEARWTDRLTDLHERHAHERPTHERPTHERPGDSDERPAHLDEPRVRDAPATIDVRDPATGEHLRAVACDTEHEIAAKLQRARAAQVSWRARKLDDRRAVMLALERSMAEEAEALASTTTSETGRAITQSRNEVSAARERIRWFADHVEAAIAPREVGDASGTEERVTYEPLGVVAHISAWNYPYFVGLNAIVPAMLTGNAVLYKPSELATLTGLALVDLAHRSGVPIDVLQCVVGAGATGAALVESGIDMVCFTGSHATGMRVARSAAEHLLRVQLELGGKDALYVCDDVDIEWAATAAAEGAFYHAGQSCCALERIYVHERIWEPFVAAFVVATRRDWALGDPKIATTTLGALAREQQPELLQAHVDDALSKGGRLLLGGESPTGRAGNWYPPTVIVDVDHSMRVMREESFGPVIGLMRARDDNEAITLMDDTQYGLTGAVFSDDRERAERLLNALDTGTVYWNCSDRTTASLEWAGRRHSGLGVSMGIDGIRSFVRPKAWHLRPRA